MRKKIGDEVIYEAALKVFAKYGYRKATLEDIAGEMGMTAANLYAYSRSKRALYEQTVSCAMLRWQEKVRAAVSKKRRAADKLSALAETFERVRDFCPILPLHEVAEEVQRQGSL